MLESGASQIVCVTAAEIPEAARGSVLPEIHEYLGSSIDRIYPSFAAAFPVTCSALVRHWPNPKLALEFVVDTWVATLVCEGSQENLFFKLNYPESWLDSREFDEYTSMLPVRWRELYRRFDSFCIVQESFMPMQWKNTPFSFAARLSIAEIVRFIDTSRETVRNLDERFAQGDFHCWLWTEAGDGLFIDERAREQQIYHMRDNNLSDVRPIGDTNHVLDRYLGHLIAGGKPAAFRFRAPG